MRCRVATAKVPVIAAIYCCAAGDSFRMTPAGITLLIGSTPLLEIPGTTDSVSIAVYVRIFTRLAGTQLAVGIMVDCIAVGFGSPAAI